MFLILVNVYVKPDYIEAFKAATVENARNSVQEAGIVRFDVIQQRDEPTHFMLVEVYRSDDAPAKHKETPHYLKWSKSVVGMMAEPRISQKFDNVFPPDADWG